MVQSLFRNLRNFVSCLSEETLKAVGSLYLVSRLGEVKYPICKCVTCSGLTNSRWTLNALQRAPPVQYLRERERAHRGGARDQCHRFFGNKMGNAKLWFSWFSSFISNLVSFNRPTLARLHNFAEKVWSPSGLLNVICVKCCHLMEPE